MSETEVGEWLKLLQGGGSAGIIVLALLAIKVANRFLGALEKIVTTQNTQHAAVLAGQESIKRAIVASNPRAEAIFREDEMRRAGGA